MEEDCLAESNIGDLARTLGITDRHLRRVFEQEFGVTPVRYLQTRRLLLAKSLLTDTTLPVTQVALTAGFKSIRRFNELFQERYRMAPSRFRKVNGNVQTGSDSITLLLGYRPPYEWHSILTFFAQRTIDGVEAVCDGSYLRAVCLNDGSTECSGWLSVTHMPSKNALAVTVSSGLLPVLSRVLARVRQLFDINCDPARIQQTLGVRDLPGGRPYAPGTRVPGCFDPFEMAVRAILGQQVTVKAARTLAKRLVEAFGHSVQTPFATLSYTFPKPRTIVDLPSPIEDQLGPLGITGARARSIRALAQALEQGTVELSTAADAQQQMERLLKLPGFGPWTVHYVAMRALGWPDAFPHTDFGVKKALAPLDPQQILKLAQAWQPWRSYVTVSLWNSLSEDNVHEKAEEASVSRRKRIRDTTTTRGREI
jgi:AraC family transcriptional regulator of adaptative response / DNA-3-methyladenine glycosylase II